jgi:hypothetical protein
MTVKLVEVSTGVWGKTETNADGRYAFTLTQPRGTWRVRFPGKVISHSIGHRHSCMESASPTVTVRVLG